MKSSFTSLIVLTTLCSTVNAEPKVNYAGEGRFTCSGSAAQCYQVDQNNRREAESRTRQYQADQDNAQAIVDRERRYDEERKRKRSNAD